jgi:hypothetical protein
MSAHKGIVLQKSKVAAVQIFGENLKRKEVNDSHSLGRATEVAHELAQGDEVPQIITRITRQRPAESLTHLCKTTFATVSVISGNAASSASCLLLG